MSAVNLRPYQTQAVRDLRNAYRDGARRLLLVSPTGAGKTVMAGALVSSAREKARRVLYVAHRSELLDQPLHLLRSMGLHCGRIQAGFPEDRGAPIQVASIATLKNRAKPAADLVIVDEAHRAVTASYRCLGGYPAHLGLTATPWRLDGRGLGSRFDVMVEAGTAMGLTQDGWLVPVRTFAPHAPDLPKAKGADYTREQIASAMDRGELIGDVVRHWLDHARGRPTVVFAASVRHSQRLCERFNTAGIAAVHIDSRSADEVRKAAWKMPVVCNVEIATEGIDVPRLSCAVIARPTASLTKHLQMCGRIMRPEEGKEDALLLDHAGNTLRHGLPADAREWSLHGRELRRSGGGARVCSFCFAACPTGARVCTECGRDFPVTPTPRKLKSERKGQLIEQRARAKGQRTPPTQKRRELERLREVARKRGYRRGWASHQYRLRFGEWPP